MSAQQPSSSGKLLAAMALLMGANFIPQLQSPAEAGVVSAVLGAEQVAWEEQQDSQSPDRILAILRGHSLRVNTVVFSPDGKWIASGSADSTVRLWNIDTEKYTIFSGHVDWVWSVAFSPDGKRIVSGSADNTVRIWDTSTGKEIHVLRGHTDDVRSVAFSPDGKRIASGSIDKTIRLWDASSGKRLSPDIASFSET